MFVESECLSRCPVYDLFLTSDDHFVLIPHKYIKFKRAVRGQLAQGTFKAVVAVVAETKYYSVDTVHTAYFHYTEKTKCPSFGTDQPSNVFKLAIGDQLTYIQLDMGCSGFEGREELIDLLTTIKEALGIKALVYKAKVNSSN